MPHTRIRQAAAHRRIEVRPGSEFSRRIARQCARPGERKSGDTAEPRQQTEGVQACSPNASRAAARVAASSASPCAAETKPASKADGAR